MEAGVMTFSTDYTVAHFIDTPLRATRIATNTRHRNNPTLCIILEHTGAVSAPQIC